MHTENLPAWHHDHLFDQGSRAAERGARAVMWITLVMMAVEITAGWWFNSMALLADGWHMSSHALAIGLSAFAYAAARRLARDPRFAFGTWKIEVLGGFASAIMLLGVALLMTVESVQRMLRPQAIAYQEAMIVAALGLAVNLLCAYILHRAHHGAGGHHHGAHRHGSLGTPRGVHGTNHGVDGTYHGVDGTTHSVDDTTHGVHVTTHGAHASSHNVHVTTHDAQGTPGDGEPRQDLNLRSAYLHVLADAATSIMAMVALLGGWIYGWALLDPVMGILGALLVALWSKNLLIESGKVLLDREMDHPVVAEIREATETGPEHSDNRVTDLHVWRVGADAFSCVMTVVTHDRGLTADKVRAQLAIHPEVVHATVEVQLCPDAR